MAASSAAYAADAAPAPTNWNAIIIFAAFVLLTLGITYWAAQRTRTTKDFYAAGGGITGLQNGLAIAGDYMSAASFLGISALVFSAGYYGLIYSIGFLVGWPIIMFLMAEPLRNLGRFTFADVASYRLAGDADPRHGGDRHAGHRRVLSDRADGRRRPAHRAAVRAALSLRGVVVGVLMVIYVTFGGMIATTWVQIIKAGLLLGGATLMALLVLCAVRLRLQRADRQGGRGSSASTTPSCCPARPSPTRSPRFRSAWR